MKKIISISLLICMLLSAFHVVTIAEEEQTGQTPYVTGAYFQLGSYNGKPILWRCVSTDGENGILLVSDKILCFKVANAGANDRNSPNGYDIYGSNFWEESTIRTWLNSTAAAGEVEWINYPPDLEHIDTDGRPEIESNYPYADEAGFLSANNFTDAERAVMKTVSQWQDLPVDKLDLATNGISYPYIISYGRVISGMGDVGVVGSISIEEYADSYKGAMYRIDDTIFLLNPPQLLDVYNCYGTLAAEAVETPPPGTNRDSKYKGYGYWLRSQRYSIATSQMGGDNEHIFLVAYREGMLVDYSSRTEAGIRPAFYLNEAAAVIASGSGTAEDPYILTSNGPQEGIAVYCNGEPVEMDQSPVEENARLLVPMRAIFESRLARK